MRGMRMRGMRMIACKGDAHRAALSSSTQRAPFSHLAFTINRILPDDYKQSLRTQPVFLPGRPR